MELMNIDRKATRSRVDRFFKNDLQYYLLRYGYSLHDLVDGIPKEPINEASIIYQALRTCKPLYRTLIEKYYLDGELVWQIEQELHISHNSICRLRIEAICQFATNLVALQEFHKIEPVLDLRVMKKA